MRSSFFGLETGLRALLAQQQAIDLTGHNIANANTPGFSRQVARLEATTPYPVPAFNRMSSAGQMGTGVIAGSIERMRDLFIDMQLRTELAAQGDWTITRDMLARVEAVMNEPSDSGLNALLNRFWDGWQDVSTSPQNLSVRASLVERAAGLAEAFQRQHSQLRTVQSDIAEQVAISLRQFNSLLDRLAALNVQIVGVTNTGNQPNDFFDRRDQLLEELSKLAKVRVTIAPDGAAIVQLGSALLVDRDQVHHLTSAVDSSGTLEIRWANEPGAPVISGGELAGLLRLHNETIPEYLERLDAVARLLIESVNSAHAAGYDLNGESGRPFFAGSGAGDIAVADAIVADSSRIAAASTPGASGDGSRALAIARLRDDATILDAATALRPGTALPGVPGVTLTGVEVTGAPPGARFTLTRTASGQLTMTDGNSTSQTVTLADLPSGGAQIINFSLFGVTLVVRSDTSASATADQLATALQGQIATAAAKGSANSLYQALIVRLGIDGRTAQEMSANQDTLVQHLQRRREAVSGVSLDEEATNLVRLQHAYQAAARFITAVDQMLDRLINNTGIVGR
jgi:flagellar hook-associated protein 1 FlgK